MQTTRTFPHFAYTSCLEHKRTHPHLHCPWHSLQTFKSYFTLFFSLNFIFNNPSSAVPCRQRWGNSDAFLKPCPRLSPLSHSRGSPGPPALPLPAKQGSHRKAHSQAQDAAIHHLWPPQQNSSARAHKTPHFHNTVPDHSQAVCLCCVPGNAQGFLKQHGSHRPRQAFSRAVIMAVQQPSPWPLPLRYKKLPPRLLLL